MKPETNEMRDVSILYQQLVGKPTVPPYWALGFHLARWSYANLQEVKDLQVSMENAKMPLEGQWLDIDYMTVNEISLRIHRSGRRKNF